MRKIRIIFFTTVLYFFVTTFSIVFVYKFINPPITPLMLIRVAEGLLGGKNSLHIHKEWKDIDEISPNMVLALFSAEDQCFLTHHGINFDNVKRVMAYNKKHKGKKLKGGSTISQQTAKNVFLFPSRTWFRKGLEAYFTILIEILWSKERIMEVYMNVIEVGNGYYGVEAASEKYFNKTSKKLNQKEAASIAAILPLPLKWSPVKSTNFLNKRIATILFYMPQVEKPTWLPKSK